MVLGSLIKTYREKNNILQKDMAIKLGVSKSQLSKIERHLHDPKGDLSLKILKMLIPTLTNDLVYLEVLNE